MSRTTNNRRKRAARRMKKAINRCWISKGKVVPGVKSGMQFSQFSQFINEHLHGRTVCQGIPGSVLEVYDFFMKAYKEKPSLCDYLSHIEASGKYQ